MADQDSGRPMPGQVEFSADEERAMRQGARPQPRAPISMTWTDTDNKTGQSTTTDLRPMIIPKSQF